MNCSCDHKLRRWSILCLSILLTFALGTGAIESVWASTAKDIYLQAEKKYLRLKKNPKLQKYRDQWFACIDLFKGVYRHDPNGPWAAAGMYKTGELYYELYKHSFKKSDKTEALDTLQRVVKRYPKSRYRQRAQALLAAIQSKSPAPKAEKKTSKQDKLMRRAEKCYQGLLSDSRKQKYRDQWLTCIRAYKAAQAADPKGSRAAEALYRAGSLTHQLYKRSFARRDKTQALSLLNQARETYPGTAYAREASKKIAAITGKPLEPQKPDRPDAIQQVIAESKMSSPADTASPSAKSGSPASVQGLRHWSNPSYTRIVIDADKATSYRHRLLNQDPAIRKPKRLYVDLDHSRLGDKIEKVVPINDDLLSNVRAGQYKPDSVRVVVDIKSFKTYKIFSLRNPFRIVIDVWGLNGSVAGKAPKVDRTRPKVGEIPPGALAKQLALGVQRIVIDPGHGGRDYGAPGYYKGVHEKKIVLALAQKLARKIRADLGCEAFLTRTNDKYLTLEERTAIANTRNADLFISIHTNSAKDRRAYGFETYFLNLATDDEAIRVAAYENATSEKNISDLQTILTDLMQNAKINESSRLATFVQGELYQHMRKSYKKTKNKGVKQAPFYVLLGAQMPAILIESSFISNPRECKRLTDPKYQEKLCEGIVKGIRAYIQETNPTALFKSPSTAPQKG